jgi:uncharacterized protein
VTFYVPKTQLDEARNQVVGASCWVLTDGKAGDEAQCLGVAECLGLIPSIRHVKPRGIFTWAMPWGPIDPAEAFSKPNSPIAPPFPDILIASGRRTIAYVRRIKRASNKHTLTVILKDPRTGASAADLIWVPEHDKLRGPNVITTLTSPHRISPDKLLAAKALKPAWLDKHRAGAGVLLGGDSQHHQFTDSDISRFLQHLTAITAAGTKLIVTPSRRTPSTLGAAIQQLCAQTKSFYWDGTGENPYLQILAHADHIIATADSVNMVGEAAATGKPIHLFCPSGGHTKISSFVNGLSAHGVVRTLSDTLETWSYPPLDGTPVIAIAVAKAYTVLRLSNAFSPLTEI